MSKLSEAVFVTPTNERRSARVRFPEIAFTQTSALTESFAAHAQTRYDVELRLRYRVWIDESVSVDLRTVQVRQAKQAILNEVFGEFYGPLMKAQIETESGDLDRAVELLKSIRASMFDWMEL